MAHPVVLVEFYAPWCGHCKTLEPEYKKAANIIRKAGTPAVVLAKVDATVEKDLASRFSITGFPTLKMFEKSLVQPAAYDGPRDAEGIVEHLRGLAGPPSQELVDASSALTVKQGTPVVVVYAHETLPELQAWTEFARSLRKRVTFVHSTKPAVWGALGVEAGVTILKNFDEPAVRYDGELSDAAKFADFINYHRFEVAVSIKRGDKNALRTFFDDENRPSVFLFVSSTERPESQAAIESFRTAARAVRGAMVSGYFSQADFPEAFDVFGLQDAAERDELPEVLIELRRTGARYRLGKRAFAAPDVAAFLKGYFDGALTPHVKSQPEPADNHGAVRVVVGSTFDREATRAGRWVFLKAYAPWCGHCKDLAPTWDRLGEAYAGVREVS
jgi:protein disulfide isomerase